jgi:transposase
MYPLPDYGVMIRFIGMAPIDATVYELEKFRCNACGLTSTAKAPEETGQAKFDESVSAAVAFMKYGAGVPFCRLERLQKHLGVPLSSSKQWEVVDAAADLLDPVLKQLIGHAAQGEVIHHDDTAMKIMDRPDFILDKEGKERKGVYTTALISHVVADGQKRSIGLFMTGMHHGGENLEEVLKNRAEGLNVPIQMCDASANNTKGEFDTILANCLAHGRRKFVELVDYFPEECQRFLNDIKEVYENDVNTRNMTPQDRLLHHQTHSEPIMKALHKWLDDQIKEKIVEPNSDLGRAIKYMLNHWEALTLFLREPDAPLDNNLAERVIKRAVLHRKNSLYYRSINGAYVGDLFMSLIHTAEMNGANPFDYLVKTMKYHAMVKENPEEWMPWNYKNTLAGLPK